MAKICVFLFFLFSLFSYSHAEQISKLEKYSISYAEKNNVVFITDDLISSTFDKEITESQKNANSDSIFELYDYHIAKQQNNVVFAKKKLSSKTDIPLLSIKEINYLISSVKMTKMNRTEAINSLCLRMINTRGGKLDNKNMLIFPLSEIIEQEKSDIMSIFAFLFEERLRDLIKDTMFRLNGLQNKTLTFSNYKFKNYDLEMFRYFAPRTTRQRATDFVLDYGFVHTVSGIPGVDFEHGISFPSEIELVDEMHEVLREIGIADTLKRLIKYFQSMPKVPATHMKRFKSVRTIGSILAEMKQPNLTIECPDAIKDKTIIFIGNYDKSNIEKCLQISQNIADFIGFIIVKKQDGVYYLRPNTANKRVGDYLSLMPSICKDFFGAELGKQYPKNMSRDGINAEQTCQLSPSVLTEHLKPLCFGGKSLTYSDLSQEDKGIVGWMMSAELLREATRLSLWQPQDYFKGSEKLVVRIEKLASGYIFEIGQTEPFTGLFAIRLSMGAELFAR
jgi:hypothetical protein